MRLLFLHHRIACKNRRVGAEGEGDAVAGAAIQADLAFGCLEDQAGVVGAVGKIVDDHARNRRFEAISERENQIVRERARRLLPVDRPLNG